MSSPLRGSRRTPGMAADQPEAQCAGDRSGLNELDSDRIAEPVRFRTAHESAACLVKAEILLADAARRNKTIGTGFVEFDEKPGTRHPRNVPVENRTDAIGQKMRDQSIGGFALGLHGPAFGRGNVS